MSHAPLRAAALIAFVLEIPILGRIAKALTPRPEVEQLEIDGISLTVFRPPGRKARPAWVFINGAHPLRRQEPIVARLGEGLSRVGNVVVLPDVPGLGAGTITPETIDATMSVVRATRDRPDVLKGRVGLIGASVGAGLALVAAGRDEFGGDVSAVAAIAPFANLKKLICLATTGYYDDGGEFVKHSVTNLHRQVVARSLVATLAAGADRDRLVSEVSRADDSERDPLEALSDIPGGMGDQATIVLAVLANRDPHRYEDLYAALPENVREFVEDISPVSSCAGVRAAVEIVVPPLDEYFPLAEATALDAELPQARLTVTQTLDHTRPSASLDTLRELWTFGGFVVRAVRAG